MSSRFKVFLIALIIVGFSGSFVIGFGSGWFYYRNGSPGLPHSVADVQIVPASIEASSPDVQQKFDVFWQAWQLVKDNYYGRPVDEQTMVYGAAKGMLNALGDDYTTFVTPAENKAIAAEMHGSFEGIGVVFETKEKKLTVLTVFPGSPAEKAGLKDGDVVVAVDGSSVEGKTTDEVVPLIKGPKDTQVKLSILRGSAQESLDITITRAAIDVPSIRSWMLDGNIAYIRCLIFSDTTTEELDKAIVKAQQANAKGIVLDLRNNGGGYVKSAQEMVGRFVDGGVALYEVTAKVDGVETEERVLTGDVKAYNIPLVVLVNGGTASASEIVAGVLQDDGRAKLIGEKTFGKGSVQEVNNFDDGSSARVTVAHWLTPKKREIQGQGLMPDMVVPYTEADATANKDTQLDAAVKQLQK